MKKMIQKYFGRYAWCVVLALVYMLPLLLVNGAAVDYFLKIEGIPGESTDDKHKDWIIIESFSWGMSQAVSGSGSDRTLGPVERQDFFVTKWIDKASPILMLSSCGGIGFPKVEISLVNRSQTNKEAYLKYTLSDCIVSSFSGGGGGSADDRSIPTETMSLNYSKIEFQYYEYEVETGNITNAIAVSCDDGTAGEP